MSSSQLENCISKYVLLFFVIALVTRFLYQRCLKDLRERFAKCPIQQSAPIVPFRETAVKAPDMAPPKTVGAPRGTVNGTVLNGLVKFRLRAMPLPKGVETFLLSQQGAISKMLVRERGRKEGEEETDAQEGAEGQSADGEGLESQQEARQLSPEEFWTELERLLNKAGGDWIGAADRVWSFGPKRVGANLLLDPVGTKHLRLRGREQLFNQARAQGQSADDALLSTDDAVAADQLASLNSTTSDNEAARADLRLLRDYESSIEAGFQLSTFQGPLCAEPVVGMAWVVESVELDKQGMEAEQGKGQVVGGALISAVRDACRQGLLDWSPRIKLAMYTCDIQASSKSICPLYSVTKRFG